MPKPAEKSRPPGLEVKQASEYQGNDWWLWSVWIDGPKKELDEVDSVTYHLHETFPKPVRRTTDRANNFRIETEGWGEFMIAVEIAQRGKVLKKQHWLTLEYPEETISRAGGTVETKSRASKESAPTVFLSGSVSDGNLGNALGQALEHEGFNVVKMADAPFNIPLETAMSLLMKDADLMVMLISGQLTTWARREIEEALKRKLPIYPVVIGPSTPVPERLEEFHVIAVRESFDPSQVAPSVAQQIRQSVKL